jgi:hypothetical protein
MLKLRSIATIQEDKENWLSSGKFVLLLYKLYRFRCYQFLISGKEKRP